MNDRIRRTLFSGYYSRWVSISIIIGLGCGVSAIALIVAIKIVTSLMLGGIAGYYPPLPGGEGSTTIGTSSRFFLVPVAAGLGGLIGGAIVYYFAPEAEGVGTDAAIRAFHHNEARIRPRIPLVKLVTPAFTIGSGGTSGREGPIAQIGAGLGSFISDKLRLDKRSREVMVAAGLGAGIASIFKAPLAGAIIGAEIFYTHDFEVEALIPGFIASVVGYSVVGFATGWQPIFAANVNPTEFRNPLSLPLYAVLGIACAMLALLLFRVYATVTSVFRRWKAPLYVRTAVGALGTGLIGLAVPSVLGTGYGWAQIALDQNYRLFPVMLIAVACLSEIVSMSLTLGSGNSGGIFGPSVVTGGLLGAALGFGFYQIFPSIVGNPSDFAIVGMMAFFAADGKAPLSTIVLVAEMTGGYGLLAPSMFAVTTAFLFSGQKSVFPSQVLTRRQSPAHHEEFEALVLADTKVADAMTRSVITVHPQDTMERGSQLMDEHSIGGLPVVDENLHLVGIITRSDLTKVPEPRRSETTVRDIMTGKPVTCNPGDTVYEALRTMTLHEIGRLPVVRDDRPSQLVGIIARRDVGNVIEGAGKKQEMIL